MLISQKTQYAIRALFELSRRPDNKPARIRDIARAQSIPARFLEVILHSLKETGIVDSVRGRQGGYILARPPEEIRVGDVVRFLERADGPVHCNLNKRRKNCPFYGGCAFMPMWIKAREAVFAVYDNTSFKDLLDNAGGIDNLPM